MEGLCLKTEIFSNVDFSYHYEEFYVVTGISDKDDVQLNFTRSLWTSFKIDALVSVISTTRRLVLG